MDQIKLIQTPVFKPEYVENNVLDCILGEVLWHSLTIDPSIMQESDAHFENLCPIIDTLIAEVGDKRPLRILEIAAYSHVTGYRISEEYDAEVILADISPDTLTSGHIIAGKTYSEKATSKVHRWAVDFHELPFPDGSFDLVYISSAIHHTWEWDKVIQEMQRVTSKGGLIYLYNEPCFREFSFNKFRTNRIHDFCEFEQKLEDCGLLRTIAEPYYGSRAEALFGMIENQTIVFDELIGVLERSCTLVNLDVSPEICMGELEHRLIANRVNGQESLAQEIQGELLSKLNIIKVGAMERSMGMSLPSLSEIDVFSKKLSEKIIATNASNSAEELRVELVRIFGGAVNILVKKTEGTRSEKGILSLGENDVVNVGYPESVSQILNKSRDLFINIQSSSENVLSSFFSDAEWVQGQGEAGRYISIVDNGASLKVDCQNESRAISLIRIYLGYNKVPYKFQMLVDGTVAGEYEVYKTDSILMRNELNISEQESVKLELRAVNMLDNKLCSTPMPMALNAIRVIALK
jgi:ubiquinone/menaquinone biosynthesis C-methylase UbiE